MPVRLLIIFSLCYTTLSALAMTDNSSPLEVNVGVYHNPPLIFMDDDGQGKGIFIDILEHIAQKEKWHLNYIQYSLSEALLAIKNNQIDLIPAIAYSEERAKNFSFSKDVVFTNWGVIYVTRESDIKSISDLSQKKLGIENGNIHSNAFIQLLKDFNIKTDIFHYDNQQQLISAISNKDIEAIVTNKILGHKHLSHSKLKETPILFNPVRIHFITHNSNTELMARLDDSIGDFLKNSSDTYHSIINQWLMISADKEKPLWLKLTGVAVIILFFILLINLISLRFKVRKKTTALKEELRQRVYNERLIKQLENEKELLLNSIDDQVVFVDSNYHILWANRAYKERSIKNFADQQGKKCYEIVYGINKQCEYCQIDTCLSSKATEVCEYFDQLNQKHYRTKTSPVYNGEGILMGFVKILTDITDKKKNEQDLIAAKEKAEESDYLKSAFLANMSHEIRTPMNAIIGFSELLEDDELPTNQKRNYLKIIQSNGQQLLKLISDILIFSQLESGHINLQYSKINIIELLNDIYQQFQSDSIRSKNPNIQLKLHCERIDNTTELYSDNIRLKQIIFNLMTNAEKFTRNGEITLGCYIENEMLIIYVKDTGIGIPEDQLDNIFKRFSQVENNQVKKVAGSGLGLAISTELCHLLGGYIKVESKINYGSTFKVYHPLLIQSNHSKIFKSETVAL